MAYPAHVAGEAFFKDDLIRVQREPHQQAVAVCKEFNRDEVLEALEGDVQLEEAFLNVVVKLSDIVADCRI